MRINVIPVEYLADVHLRAEYREIIMSIHYYKRSLRSPTGINESRISERYTLNGGHGYMWYNKFGFIYDRFFRLYNEMNSRNLKCDTIFTKFVKDYNTYIPEHARLSYNVSDEDIKVNISRIIERIYIKETGFYKLRGANLTFLDWCILYTEKLNLDAAWVHNLIVSIENKYSRITNGSSN